MIDTGLKYLQARKKKDDDPNFKTKIPNVSLPSVEQYIVLDGVLW